MSDKNRPKVTPITGGVDRAQGLKMLSSLVSRAMIFSRLGYEYGGDRDLYQALGLRLELRYEDFVTQYERQELAKAVIDRPVSARWRGGFDLLESDDDKETPFEKDWKELDKRLKLCSVFTRLDKLTGLGRYGVLFLGLSDARTVFDQQKPVTGVKHKLLFVKPYGEGNAQILEYEVDPTNPRYGMPNIYQLSSQDLLSNVTVTYRVHHSRVIHVVDGALESDIEGTPRLEVIFNNLKAVEKIAQGSAEMFWRGARPGYEFELDPDFTMSPEAEAELQDQLDEYENNLRRFFKIQGGKLNSLAPQVEDPSKHIDIHLQLISAEKQIPKRILTGSERGELASSQDIENWQSTVQGWREDFAEAQEIIPFVDRLIEFQVISAPGEDGYSVKWRDSFAMSEKEKVEVGKGRSSSLKDYAATPGASEIVSKKTFLRECWALDDNQIDLNEQELEQDMVDEEKLQEELGSDLAPGNQPSVEEGGQGQGEGNVPEGNPPGPTA